jgi:hypothetical protein
VREGGKGQLGRFQEVEAPKRCRRTVRRRCDTGVAVDARGGDAADWTGRLTVCKGEKLLDRVR